MGGAKDGLFLMRRVERLISSSEHLFLNSWFVTACLLNVQEHRLVFKCLLTACWLVYFIVLVWSVSLFYSLSVVSMPAWVHKETRGETFSWCHHSWGVHDLCLLRHVIYSMWHKSYMITQLLHYHFDSFFFPVLWTLVERYFDLVKRGFI